MRFPYLFLFFFTASSLAAQLPLTPEFSAMLDSFDLRLNHPDDDDFKLKPNPENDYLADQLTLYSKAEKLEIRFHLRPESERDIYYQRPHMRTGMLVMNLASNDEDAVTTVHAFDEEELITYGADWAKMYTFRPKRSYSPRATAQLIAIYKQGSGLAYTILLFDKAPEALEARQFSLGFRE